MYQVIVSLLLSVSAIHIMVGMNPRDYELDDEATMRVRRIALFGE